jgi:hypothetical protein
MKIDFSYLMSGKFQLCENNILYTIENILSEKSKFSIFGRFPNEDGEGFFYIDQVQVLNAVYDVEIEAKCQPKVRKWDKDEEEMGEKFEKKMSILFILSHPAIKGMRSPRIFFTVDIRLKGFVDFERYLYVQDVIVQKEELVPGYGGLKFSPDYRKYFSPMMISLYREVQIAKNNALNNGVALLAEKFIDVVLSEEYGIDASASMDNKTNAIKEQNLKNVLEYVNKTENSIKNHICGKKLKNVTDEDVDKIMDFLHIFIENFISPKRAADLEKETEMILRGSKSMGF